MPLDNQRIIDQALSILNTYGLEDISMRRLAKELHVAPGALYWYFPNKQAIISQLAYTILQPILQPDSYSIHGSITVEEDSLEKYCDRLKDILLSHNDSAEIVLSAFSNSPLKEDLCTSMLPYTDLITARTLLYFIIGTIYTVQQKLRLSSFALNEGKEQDRAAILHDACIEYQEGIARILNPTPDSSQ